MNMKSVNQMTDRKILIVDDDEGILTQLKWGLSDYEVITASSRLHAIEQFELHHPHLVTLDLGLPPDAEGTTQGFAILNDILKKAPDTKVVIVSGAEEQGAAEKARNNGAFDFISKPIELNSFQRIIEQAYTSIKE